jgi:hypothetical protein
VADGGTVRTSGDVDHRVPFQPEPPVTEEVTPEEVALHAPSGTRYPVTDRDVEEE